MPDILQYTEGDNLPYYQHYPDAEENKLYQPAQAQGSAQVQYPLPVEAPTFQQPVEASKPAYKLTQVDVDPFQSTGTENNIKDESSGFKPLDKLFGLGGQERYQTWPEKMVREAVTAPHDVMNSPTPMTSEQMIPAAQAISSLAAVGSMPMAGKGTLGALGGRLIQVDHDPFATAPTFYSAVENGINQVPENVLTGEQWLSRVWQPESTRTVAVRDPATNKPTGETRQVVMPASSPMKGVKPEELDWLGLREFLNENKGKPVTKQEVLDHVEGNKVGLQEINKGNTIDPDTIYEQAKNIVEERYPQYNPDHPMYEELIRDVSDELEGASKSSTKFSSYQLPGGENYREMLLTLPYEKKGLQIREGETAIDAFDRMNAENKQPYYKSSHWDEPNVLAHVRMNDRVIDGKKSLHLEEIQSDWHQAGRGKGYDSPAERAKDLNELPEGYKVGIGHLNGRDRYEVREPDGKLIAAHATKDGAVVSALNHVNDELRRARGQEGSPVPDAPFKKSWHELALKRMIREAAEKGYDRISWTPGEAQAARYDLSKQVDTIQATKLPDGTYNVYARPLNDAGFSPVGHSIPENKLAESVGKDLAEKIIKQDVDKAKSYKGVDLKIGGEGMKGFYDQIIPKAVEKIGKEHGVKVKQGGAETHRGYPEQLSVMDKNGNHVKDFKTMDEARKFLNDPSNGVFGGKIKGNKAIPPKIEPIHYIDIPQSLKDTALRKGFPLFSSGMMLSPVEHNPFEENK